MIAVIKTAQNELYTLGKDGVWSGPDSIICGWLNVMCIPSKFSGPEIPSPQRGAVATAATKFDAEITWGEDLEPENDQADGTIH